MRLMVSGICAALVAAILISAGNFQAGEKKKKPKYTISEVMKKAHKSGLLKKVAKGQADKGEKEQLVEYYVALSLNKPPKGDADEWKKRTGKMVKLAKAVAGGKEKAAKALGKAASCGACHKKHKG